MNTPHLAGLALALLAASGCIQVKTESEIKPIHITMDVNLKVDKELDRQFSDEQRAKPQGDFKEIKAMLDRQAAGVTAQAMLEARIVTIEATLKNAVLIDEEDISNEHVHIGSNVKLLNLRTDSEVTYKIVGSNEANPSAGKISDESPVGMALIGHSVGDVVEVEVPVGVIGFKVLEIFK